MAVGIEESRANGQAISANDPLGGRGIDVFGNASDLTPGNPNVRLEIGVPGSIDQTSIFYQQIEFSTHCKAPLRIIILLVHALLYLTVYF